MVSRSLSAAAIQGLAASAFLLPPDVSTEVTHGEPELDPWTLLNPQWQPLLVPCLGCESEKSAPQSLLLNISVGAEPGTLELGGTPFYPPSAYMLAESKPTVVVVPSEISMYDAMVTRDQYSTVPISSLAVAVHNPRTQSANGEELLVLDMVVSGIDDKEGYIPTVKMNILKEADNSLTILSTSFAADMPTLDPATHNEDKKPACESTLCQWRQFLEDKIEGITSAAHKQFGHGRPCPGKMRGMMKDGKFPHGGPFTNMHHGPGSHHHRPIGETGRPHHHHGHPKMHHHHHSGFRHFMHRVGHFIMAVAIPILIGIAAGVLTYAIGMVVGMVIALVWIKVFRGGKRGYASVALTEDDALAKEDEEAAEPRESFESAPPVYEDAPAYEEKQVV